MTLSVSTVDSRKFLKKGLYNWSKKTGRRFSTNTRQFWQDEMNTFRTFLMLRGWLNLNPCEHSAAYRKNLPFKDKLKVAFLRKYGNMEVPNCHLIWNKASVPQTWKDVTSMPIYRKGDRTDCGNCGKSFSCPLQARFFQEPSRHSFPAPQTRSRVSVWITIQ